MTSTHDAVLLELVEPIVDAIRARVPAYAGPAGDDRHGLIRTAVDAGVRAHVDATVTARHKAGRLFRRIGRRAAEAGDTADELELALRTAARVAWRHLADHVADRERPVEELRDVIDELLEHVDHLRTELLSGHRQRRRDPDPATTGADDRLWDLLLGPAGRISPLRPGGVDPGRLDDLAGRARWTVPGRAVAIAVHYQGAAPRIPEAADVLALSRPGRLLVLCPEDRGEELAAALSRPAGERQVALSRPVSPEESGVALTWALRALDLARLGVIPPAPVVRCADHSTQLWLHSEPSMRQRLCRDLLEPLLAESPNSREILSETLLIWLETRDSAPAIAARLGVHPQTVRYRWRRINELLGPSLRDPEFIIQTTLVLKSSLLLWKNGDTSDFERLGETGR